MTAKQNLTELPEHIIHHIISFLPDIKEIFRTSVLSKTWLNILLSYPISEFDGTLFEGEETFINSNRRVPEVRNNEFIKFVGNALSRFCKNQIKFDKFKLNMIHYKVEYASHIDHWIEILSTKNNLKTFDLSIQAKEKNTWYSLPENIFMLKSLVVLKLSGYKFEKASFSNTTMKFVSLQELCLTDVYLDDVLLQMLVNCCPSLKYFALLHCPGWLNLQLSCLPKLEKVQVSQIKFKNDHDDEEEDVIGSITIEAPNLEIFEYDGCFKECKIDAASCKNIKELNLNKAFIYDAMFCDFMSNFSFVNILALHCCPRLTRINISSHQLQCLRLEYLNDLREAQIDAPNLHLFKYLHADLGLEAELNFSRAMINNSSLQKVATFYLTSNINASLFERLKKFIGSVGTNTTLELHLETRLNEWTPEELSDIGPPPVLKHLKLIVHYLHDKAPEMGFKILDGLLWICHPKTLSIPLGPYEALNHPLLKCFCEMLIKKRNDPDFYKSTPTRCWCHLLKDYRITRINDEEIFSSDALLEILPSQEDILNNRKSLTKQEFHFNLEW